MKTTLLYSAALAIILCAAPALADDAAQTPAPATTPVTTGDLPMSKPADSKTYEKTGDAVAKLTDMQRYVTQEDGTERPFHNEYWDNHADGIYVDVVSGEPLFSSKDKFDSGTGWPSFTKPLDPDFVKENSDYKLGVKRTEIRSKDGNSHLGHVFNDGPKDKGGLRYCMNSAALRFIPKEKLAEEGYGQYLKLFEDTPAETAR